MNTDNLSQIRAELDSVIAALYGVESLLRLAWLAIPPCGQNEQVEHCRNAVRAIADLVAARTEDLDLKVAMGLDRMLGQVSNDLL